MHWLLIIILITKSGDFQITDMRFNSKQGCETGFNYIKDRVGYVDNHVCMEDN